MAFLSLSLYIYIYVYCIFLLLLFSFVRPIVIVLCPSVRPVFRPVVVVLCPSSVPSSSSVRPSISLCPPRRRRLLSVVRPVVVALRLCVRPVVVCDELYSAVVLKAARFSDLDLATTELLDRELYPSLARMSYDDLSAFFKSL